MATFRDNDGRSWVLAIDPIVADRLARDLGVDIDEAVTGEMFAKLERSPKLVYRTAWEMAKANASGSTEAEFYAAIGGDSEALLAAVVEAVASFQVRPEVARYLRAIASAITQADRGVLATVSAALESVSLHGGRQES